jgi:hypothetical protein
MKVCIACQKDMEGKKAVPVKEDRIIKTIRAVKKAMGIAQMNELYVCEADIAEHLKRRRSFEKSLLFASVLAGLIIVVVIVALLLSGRFDLWAIISALIIGGFILVLPLFKYSPAVEEGAPMHIGPVMRPYVPLPAAKKAAQAKEAAPAKAPASKKTLSPKKAAAKKAAKKRPAKKPKKR